MRSIFNRYRRLVIIALILFLVGTSGVLYYRTVHLRNELASSLAYTMHYHVNQNLSLLRIYFDDGSEEEAVGPHRLEMIRWRLHQLNQPMAQAGTYMRVAGNRAPTNYMSSINHDFIIPIGQCISQRIESREVPWELTEEDRALLTYYAETFGYIRELSPEQPVDWAENFYSAEAPWIQFLRTWADLAEAHDWEACSPDA